MLPGCLSARAGRCCACSLVGMRWAGGSQPAGPSQQACAGNGERARQAELARQRVPHRLAVVEYQLRSLVIATVKA